MIDVQPLSPTIGAELHGVDLSRVDDVTRKEIREALLAYKVVFFRDQQITTEQHLDFARGFGELEVHPFGQNMEGQPEVLVIAHDADNRGRENFWHSDVTWRQEPSLGSVLRAREVPEVGGDTLFADMYEAYEGLSDKMQRFVSDLVAVHDFTATFGRLYDAETLKVMQEKYPPAEHPVVRTHPETGRKGLYVNVAFTSHIAGMLPGESQKLLEQLYQQARIPEYQCRFRWRKDSIAFWDNRSSQHYAASDYHPARRVMERVTIVGDQPR
jgi:taurine dioxygenase